MEPMAIREVQVCHRCGKKAPSLGILTRQPVCHTHYMQEYRSRPPVMTAPEVARSFEDDPWCELCRKGKPARFLLLDIDSETFCDQFGDFFTLDPQRDDYQAVCEECYDPDEWDVSETTTLRAQFRYAQYLLDEITQVTPMRYKETGYPRSR